MTATTPYKDAGQTINNGKDVTEELEQACDNENEDVSE